MHLLITVALQLWIMRNVEKQASPCFPLFHFRTCYHCYRTSCSFEAEGRVWCLLRRSGRCAWPWCTWPRGCAARSPRASSCPTTPRCASQEPRALWLLPLVPGQMDPTKWTQPIGPNQLDPTNWTLTNQNNCYVKTLFCIVFYSSNKQNFVSK